MPVKFVYYECEEMYKAFTEEHSEMPFSKAEFFSIVSVLGKEYLDIIQVFFYNSTARAEDCTNVTGLKASKIRDRINKLRELGILIKIEGKREHFINFVNLNSNYYKRCIENEEKNRKSKLEEERIRVLEEIKNSAVQKYQNFSEEIGIQPHSPSYFKELPLFTWEKLDEIVHWIRQKFILRFLRA